MVACAVGILAAGSVAARAQATGQSSAPDATAGTPASATQTAEPSTTAGPTVAGGKLHGVVKSGNIPLPGVTITAQNTLTGKKYSTTSDITGAWSMSLAQNGRYVIRTEFAAFAVGALEAVLNAASHDQTVNFELMLASRAAQQEQQASQAATLQAASSIVQQLAGNGTESLSLTSALSADTDTSSGSAGRSGAELPTVANNSDFGGDSVAISGQSGQVSPLAGVNLDQIRDAIAAYQVANPGQGLPGAGGLFGGGGWIWWRRIWRWWGWIWRRWRRIRRTRRRR